MAIRTELTSGRLLHDFATWCTIACLNRIASSNWIMATVFTIIFVNMLALFIYISVMCTIKYFSLPIATELTIDVTAQKFPRISVCNENPLKRSVIDSMPEFAEISRLIDQFERIALNKTTDDDYGIGEVRGFMHRQRRARLMLRLLMAKMDEESRRAGGYNFTEMLSECIYAGKTCSSRDFSSFLHPDYGNCFTFSIDGEATRPGRKEGLRLMMTVNQQSTDGGPFDYMPTTDSASIWAVIHDEEDFPDFTKNGFRIAAGTQALVSLSKVEFSRIASPYGNCSENGDEIDNYYENFTYTHAHCQESCLQSKAVELCGCADPLFRKNDSHRYCQTSEEMLCLRSLTHTISPANEKGAPICVCPQPCSETVYKRTISASVFPSDKYLVSAGTQAQRGVLLGEQNGGRPGTCNDESEFYDDQQQSCSTTQDPTLSTTSSGTTSTTTTITTVSTEAPSAAPTVSYTATSTIESTSTAASMSTTTATPAMCPYPKQPSEILDELDPKANGCEDDQVIKNPKFTVIMGYPCKSGKRCQTCVFVKNQSDPLAWPCTYNYPKECENRNDHALSREDCATFFRDFDFIPWNTSEPVFEWDSGKGPGSIPCNTGTEEEKKSCREQQQCGVINRTVSNPHPLLEDAFMEIIDKSGDTYPCLVSKAARELALAKIEHDRGNGNPGSSTDCGFLGLKCLFKRNKRSVDIANQPKQPVVDAPGFGSCEYANKNFRGAKECVQWYRRNGLILHVFFENFEVRTYTQGATYTLVALLSDIAGHAGLWLGMSVVSVVEIAAFFIMWLVKWCSGKKVKITDEEVVEGAIKRGREEKKMYK